MAERARSSVLLEEAMGEKDRRIHVDKRWVEVIYREVE